MLDSVFDKWWPELEVQVNKILEEIGEGDSEPIRADRELLEEILELSRMSSQRSSTPVNLRAIRSLLADYIAIHEQQVAGLGGYQETLDALAEMKDVIEYLSSRYRGRNKDLDELIEKFASLTFIHIKPEQEKPVTEDDIPC